MSKNFNRRDFIKTSLIGTGGVAVASSAYGWVPSFLDNSESPLLESKAKRTPTICEVCFWNCAGWVYKDREGNIQKIIGNENDPNSNGKLCPRDIHRSRPFEKTINESRGARISKIQRSRMG
jgi:thiosulfate reductase / polysulfide reductase chain A